MIERGLKTGLADFLGEAKSVSGSESIVPTQAERRLLMGKIEDCEVSRLLS